MTKANPDVKLKNFRLENELAYEFELHAKKMKTSEVKLIKRYIKEGIMRDKGQTRLDSEN